MPEEINLSPIDKKLLAHLYHNSRLPLTKIAKALHLSREQVSYRIKKFENENIIGGYLPLINYSKLGYHNLVLIFFRFNKSQYSNQFKHALKNDKNRITTIEILSKYDLGMLFVFKNEKERNTHLSNLLQEHNGQISDYLILEPYFSELYPLKFLGSKQSPPNIFHEYKQEEYTLDEKEKNILSIINKNANTSIIDIAKTTNMSAELVFYKLKNLMKKRVLISTRAYFNMQKIGYFYSIILINMNNFSKQNQEKLRQFANENQFIDSFMSFFGKPNCYIQLFHKDVRELHETIEKLKETFKNESFSFDILPLKNEGEDINALPFL